jgi:hypothetical protein
VGSVGADINAGAGIGICDDDIELATGGMAGGEKEGAMIPGTSGWIKGE